MWGQDRPSLAKDIGPIQGQYPMQAGKGNCLRANIQTDIIIIPYTLRRGNNRNILHNKRWSPQVKLNGEMTTSWGRVKGKKCKMDTVYTRYAWHIPLPVEHSSWLSHPAATNSEKEREEPSKHYIMDHQQFVNSNLTRQFANRSKRTQIHISTTPFI